MTAKSAAAREQPAGLYINEAAKLVGVSAGVVRRWQASGLVSPRRSPAGYRVFNEQDVARLRQVRRLVEDEGLNLAGVRRELARTSPAPEAPAPTPPPISARIAALRRQKGLTLRALAERSGLSASTLSGIERGLTRPTVASLHALALGFEMTVSDLAGAEHAENDVVVRADARPLLDAGLDGVIIQNLSLSDTPMEGILFTIDPGAGSGQTYNHPGHEFVYMVRGTLELTIEPFGPVLMGPGDAATFAGRRHHGWRNTSNDVAVVLWVTSGGAEPHI